METSVLSTVGAVAGIGGLALGVFFLLFREIIRKSIFPMLTKEQAYRTINRAMILTTLVGLAGLGSWVLTRVWQTEATSAPRGTLSLVAVGFDPEAKEFPKLDIKIRNTGEVAFLKRADFNVKHVWELESYYCPMAEPASWNYDVLLPTVGAPYRRSKEISQSVRPQDVDRFTFTIGNDGATPLSSYVFLANVSLVYNENEQILTTPDVLFSSRPPAEIMASATCRDPRDVYVANHAAFDRILKFDGPINSPLEELRNSLPDSLIPELTKQIADPATDLEQVKYALGFLRRIAAFDPTAIASLRTVASGTSRAEVKTMAESELQHATTAAVDGE